MPERILVEVVYALPDQVFRQVVSLPQGSSVAEAIEQSSLRARHPELAGSDLRFGIYSRQVVGDHALREGDRVEVYRPLQLDPKEARRRRAAQRQEPGP